MISLIIVSAKRPRVLMETIESVLNQSLLPDNIVIVVDKPDDIGDIELLASRRIQIVYSSGSLTFKRNFGLKHVGAPEWVLFLDDDVELHSDYIRSAVDFCNRNPCWVAFSGDVIWEGKIARSEARTMLANSTARWPKPLTKGAMVSSLYGCNMVIRFSALQVEMFDERLPLYSFAEDYDISMRLRRFGTLGRVPFCRIVHLKADGGRLNNKRLVYSMIANNYYFIKKGSRHRGALGSWVRMLWLALKIPIEIGSFHGGRKAWADFFRGRLHPMRILDDDFR